MATLPGAWRYRIRTGTGRPGVRTLWLGEVESLLWNFYLSVAALKTEQIRAWDTLACCWDVKKTNKQTNRQTNRQTNKPQPSNTHLSLALFLCAFLLLLSASLLLLLASLLFLSASLLFLFTAPLLLFLLPASALRLLCLPGRGVVLLCRRGRGLLPWDPLVLLIDWLAD